jgi:hypothetical protein
MTRLRNVATLGSQLLNVLLLNGSPDETIRGRAHREGWRAERWLNRLFWLDPDHCRRSHERDREFALFILGDR